MRKACIYKSFIESSIIINYPKKNEINPEDDFEKSLDNIELEKNKNYSENQDDGNFNNIYFFNGYIENKKEDNVQNIENKKSEVNNNSDDNNKGNLSTNRNIINEEKNKKDTSSSIYNSNQIKIIYINQLVSLKDIKDDKIIEYLDLFNYNPKYYIKFQNFILKYPNDSLHSVLTKFLEITYTQISKKIMKYYNETEANILKNEPIIELIKLKDLVDNKVTFTAPVLIRYIEEYPIKWIKIKISKNIKNDKEDIIIDLNNQFYDTEFNFEYCFPFFGLILSKIIYMNENYHLINYENLSGSAKGSFIEQKIKRSIIYDKCFYEDIKLRYVWDFTSPIKEVSKDINQIDYINFEKIIYDENAINLVLPISTYYIVPSSQINKNLDSAILSPYLADNRMFNLITFQIKQGKGSEIKTKKEYVKYSFIAKNKFQELYNIIISKVYFYFIITKESGTEQNIGDLNSKNISFLFFSLKEHIIFKEENKNYY